VKEASGQEDSTTATPQLSPCHVKLSTAVLATKDARTPTATRRWVGTPRQTVTPVIMAAPVQYRVWAKVIRISCQTAAHHATL